MLNQINQVHILIPDFFHDLFLGAESFVRTKMAKIFPRLLWNSEFLLSCSKIPPLDTVLNQVNKIPSSYLVSSRPVLILPPFMHLGLPRVYVCVLRFTLPTPVKRRCPAVACVKCFVCVQFCFRKFRYFQIQSFY